VVSIDHDLEKQEDTVSGTSVVGEVLVLGVKGFTYPGLGTPCFDSEFGTEAVEVEGARLEVGVAL